jgi:hypothetical protein
MRRFRPSRALVGVIVTWFGVALLMAAIALPASAGTKGKGQSKRKNHASHAKNIKDTSGGSWGPNGHQPSSNSFPQGHSASDPDGSSNGGADKPGGTGGFNSDRDGNNGCGNDTDREDDNNGWCGNKPHNEKEASFHENARGNEREVAAEREEVSPETAPTALAPQVLGERVSRPAPQQSTQVLGVNLARTGMHLSLLMIIGFGLVPLGALIFMSARRELSRIS